MQMSNKMYDLLKKISLMAVPIATFILTMADIWKFPYGNQLAATVSAIGILIGACLIISSKHYNPEDEENKNE